MRQFQYVIGLGTSLFDGDRRLSEVFNFLKNQDYFDVLSSSSIYKTAPMGGIVFSYFFNAAVLVESKLSAMALLQELMAIEQYYGRIRDQKNGARTLDLDILWSNIAIKNENLCVPHEGLWQRDFAFIPAVECFNRAGHHLPIDFEAHAYLFAATYLEKTSNTSF